MLTRVDHVMLAVRDLSRAVEQYSALLGRSPSWCGQLSAVGADTAVYRLANTSLQLASPRRGDPAAGPLMDSLEEMGEGVCGVGFAADDVAAFGTLLAERGLSAGPVLTGERVAEPGAEAIASSEPGASQSANDEPVRFLRIPRTGAQGTPIDIVEEPTEEPEASPADLSVPGREAVSALDHIVIQSRDLAASGRLYGDQLGIRLALDRQFPERGLHMLFFRLAGVTVEVVGLIDPPDDSSVGDRFGGLAWRVDDVCAIHERLTRQGLDISAHRAGHKAGTRVFTVKQGTHGVPTLIIGPESQ